MITPQTGLVLSLLCSKQADVDLQALCKIEPVVKTFSEKIMKKQDYTFIVEYDFDSRSIFFVIYKSPNIKISIATKSRVLRNTSEKTSYLGCKIVFKV